MNDVELLQLQMLLNKLKVAKPELTVLVTELSDEAVHDLTHNNEVYHCGLLLQIEMCLHDERNDNLR